LHPRAASEQLAGLMRAAFVAAEISLSPVVAFLSGRAYTARPRSQAGDAKAEQAGRRKRIEKVVDFQRFAVKIAAPSPETWKVPGNTDALAASALFKSSADNLCGDSCHALWCELTEWPRSPAMGYWSLNCLKAQSYQVKSLILAQIERWRRA
jgi:hypothetical protein